MCIQMLVKDRTEEAAVSRAVFRLYHRSDTYKGGEESMWDSSEKAIEKVSAWLIRGSQNSDCPSEES